MTLTAKQKRELLARLMSERDEVGDLPLSFGQEALWFLDRLNSGSAAYNVPVVVRFAGVLDTGTMHRCVTEVVRRHSVLRSVFDEVGGRPVRRVRSMLDVPVRVTDLSEAHDARQLARDLVRAEAEAPFDLRQGPLIRFRVLRLSEADYWVLATAHHVVMDGWSWDVVFDELAVLYRSLTGAADESLRPLPVRYGDWVRWQRDLLTGERLTSLVNWWRERLAGAALVLELPGDRPRPVAQSHRGASLRRRLAAETVACADAARTAAGATRFVAFLTAYVVVLYRWSGQRRFVVGVPVANRGRPELDGVIGHFVNTLPFPARVDPDDTWQTLLHRIREVTVGALAHQDLPFDKLVEVLAPARSLAYNPLFQTMFILQNVERRRFGGTDQPPVEPPANGTAKMDLSLNVVESSAGVDLAFEYATDMFEQATVSRFADHFVAVLQACSADPGLRVDDIVLGPTAAPLAARDASLPVLRSDDSVMDLTGEPPAELLLASRQAGAEMSALRSADHTVAELAELAHQRSATVLSLSAADLYHLLGAWAGGAAEPPPRLRAFLVLDSALSTEPLQRWTLGEVALFFAFRPTAQAACLAVSAVPLPPPDDRPWPVPITDPVAGVTLEVCDRHARPVPVGMPGFLYARGAALVAEGDDAVPVGLRARPLSGGSIEVLGSADQAQVGGYQVDLAEVAGALRLHPAVADAAVVTLPDQDATRRLAAYLIVRRGESLTGGEAQEFLRRRLPAYRLPAAYAVLDHSVSLHARLDPTALQAPADVAAPAPVGGGALDRVARIWAEVLGLPEVHPHDNVFDLGAQSLSAVQVVSLLREEFGVKVPLRLVFEAPTVAALAAFLAGETAQ